MFDSRYLVVTLFIAFGCASSRGTQYNKCDDKWHVEMPEKEFDLSTNQNGLNVTVLDDSNGKPLREVEIGVDKEEFKYLSDGDGNVLINRSNLDSTIDSIYIRYIGFDKTRVPITDLETDSIVVNLNLCSGSPFSPTVREY